MARNRSGTGEREPEPEGTLAKMLNAAEEVWEEITDTGPDEDDGGGEGPDEPEITEAELQESARIDERLGDPAERLAGAAIRIDHSARKLVRATHRVAQVLTDAPALQSTERGVTLRRAEIRDRDSEVLWWAINLHTRALSFQNYDAFLERVLCEREGSHPLEAALRREVGRQSRMYHVPGVDIYQLLKAATEAFLLLNGGVSPRGGKGEVPTGAFTLPTALAGPGSGAAQLGRDVDRLGGEETLTLDDAQDQLALYLGDVRNNYLATVIRNAFPDGQVRLGSPFCVARGTRLDTPLLIELIWSYWMEEGMLNQTLATITRRFQNVRRAGRGPDPLAELELDPLRPLSGLIWGYVQDEPNRLSVVRRAYEYNHHYGLNLLGRAVPALRPADPRSRFLEAFHNLLRQAAAFYKEDNDTTVIADAFPVLHSLREVHLVLSEGAHNQFRDLPWQARAEMMLQQWLLARPEMHEFLRGRYMVAYPEPWMGAVDSMKRLQGWTDTSVRYFGDLATFGERILLSIRYGNWSSINNQDDARVWLRYWKEEIQGYIHAYHATTGVNLSDDVVEVRERADVRYMQPSWHLRNRLLSARRQAGAAPQ